MQLTREGDYSIRVLLELSKRPRGTLVPLEEIARRQLIPAPYLRKIVQRLAHTGFVRTFRGRGGGVRLERPPETITLRQAVEAAEGPIYLNRCLIRPGECPLDRLCPVHQVWRHVQSVLLRELDAVTFADLAMTTPRKIRTRMEISSSTMGKKRRRARTRMAGGAQDAGE
ncbi:MAG: Rrf2 family transcriptional regulator [Armatimonadota bacterium]|nr:Rrf2 family transcriptional regulator [Armatimonadota bacterium]